MKISNNSNMGDIIVNGEKITKEKTITFRAEENLYKKIENMVKNTNMSKSEICNFLMKQGFRYTFSQKEVIPIEEIISKVEKYEEKRILYLFLTLIQEKNKIKLNDINFLAGTNVTSEEFITICENSSLGNYFEDIELVESKKLKGKTLEKCLLSGNYSWEQDIEIKVKWKQQK